MGWGRRAACCVSIALACACGGRGAEPGGPDPAPDAPAGDAGAPVDAEPQPYEVVPDCDSDELWTLEPTREVRGPVGQCYLSGLHPLFRFERRPSLVPLERHERTCWRVDESNDAGWMDGTVVETAPGELWQGYVAGAAPEMIVDMRVVFEDGHLAAADDVRFVSNAGVALWDPVPELRAVTIEGDHATADAVVASGGAWRFEASDPHGMVRAGGATVWLERRTSGAWLRYAYRVRDGDSYTFETSEYELEGDASRLFLVGRRHGVHAIVGSTHQYVGFSDPLPNTRPRIFPDAAEDLGFVPDEVTQGPHGLLAREGAALRSPSEEVADELATGVDGFVQLPGDGYDRQGVLHEGRIRAIEKDDDGRLALADAPSIELSEGLGRPLFVLLDGRVVGTDGTMGPPLPPGPDHVSSEVMYGGPIVDHAVRIGRHEAEGWLIVDRPDGMHRVRIGEVPADACGL